MKKFWVISLAVLCLACACTRKEGFVDKTREDAISVYENTSRRAVEDVQVPLEGAKDAKIHVYSQRELEWKYFVDPTKEDQNWLTISDVSLASDGHWVITYDAESILTRNTLERRDGKFSFSCPSAFLGKFVTMRQGYIRQYFNDFSTLPGGTLTLTGKQTWSETELQMLNNDFYDYISFNVYAEHNRTFLEKNITLDVTIGGGAQFDDIKRSTFTVNVPVAEGADVSNFKYLLISNGGSKRMSVNTSVTFSVHNDEGVVVHVNNFAIYKVSEAELLDMADEDEFDDSEEWI